MLFDLPSVHSPIKIASESCLKNYSLTIIDSYSSKTQPISRSIEEELEIVDVVLLVYDITQPHTITTLSTFWLKQIPKHTSCPIVIIGNKLDLKHVNSAYSLDKTVKSLSTFYNNFEIVLECSAFTLENLSDIVLYVQKIVAYPIEPLFDVNTQELTPAFKRALSLVFKLCDKDRNFLLDNKEIIMMQTEVFQSGMGNEEAEALKQLVSEGFPEGLSQKCINFEGFCFLQALMIQKLQSNFCWDVLRYYGYSDSLVLYNNYSLKLLPQQRVNLSISTISFLLIVFDQYAKNGFLSLDSLKEIFSAAETPPWQQDRPQRWSDIDRIVITSNGQLPCDSWLSLWHLLAFLDPSKCFLTLQLIGYKSPCNEVLIIRKMHDQENYCRSGFLIGANGVGKSWILNGLIQRTCDEVPTSNLKFSCGVVEDSPVPWNKKFLILIEYPVIEFEVMMKNMDQCDCAVMVTNETGEAKKFIATIEIPQGTRKICVENSYRALGLAGRNELYTNICSSEQGDIVDQRGGIIKDSLYTMLTQSRNRKCFILMLLALVLSVYIGIYF